MKKNIFIFRAIVSLFVLFSACSVWAKDEDESFTSSHENSHTYLFNTLSSKYTKRGIGVVMGETSASDKNNTQERIKWAKSYFSKAKKAKVSVIFWDNGVTFASGNTDAGERHGYLNRNEISWYYPEIIEAAKNAYENR